MLNKQSVMRCISNHGPINRSAIAKMVGLSIPTVMEITDKLLEHGMVVAEMKQGKGQGKRPELLRVCRSQMAKIEYPRPTVESIHPMRPNTDRRVSSVSVVNTPRPRKMRVA